VPEGPYETLAGLVATELGRIPEPGDVLHIAGWRLDVVDASGRRAARVLLHAPLDDAGSVRSAGRDKQHGAGQGDRKRDRKGVGR
jgi:Mg2+/Co2+ transporter CorC